jgi:alpha,alpha-trehalase
MYVRDCKPEDLTPALDYITEYWSKLRHYNVRDEGTLIGLPEPYIVPSLKNGGRFSFEEQYYWDSYFIAQGLYGTKYQKYASGMLENLLSMARRFGCVPNGSRYYLMGRSQPPFLTSYILEVFEHTGKSPEWLQEAMDVAKQEYAQVWMGTAHPNWRKVFKGLSRYYDVNVLHELAEAESGWDYNGRFNGECLSYVPVDLNCLLYKYETDFEHAARIMGDPIEADIWKRRARQRKTMINKYLWNDKLGFYFDYNYVTEKRGKVWSLAGYYALWSGAASQTQAARLVAHLKKFEHVGGLSVTNASSIRDPRNIPLQWDYPNGWAPLHWIAARGLDRYGYRDDVDRIVRKWLAANLMQFKKHHVFYEKYNVVIPGMPAHEGVYPPQTGFGWSNAVFWDLAYTYLRSDEVPPAAGRHKLRSVLRPVLVSSGLAAAAETLRQARSKYID